MIGYTDLVKFSTFTVADVEKLTKNEKTAYSLLGRLMKKGLVKKIRRNIYSCVNPATGQVIATKYQIACAATPSAYISHHTAFEYYGLTNQVFYEIYVSSETKSRDFQFEDLTYRFLSSNIRNGIVYAKNTEAVRVTDLERTVVDNIKDFDKIGGLEELLNCLEGITYLNENKIKEYLDCYGLQSLYQKTGFILYNYKDEMQLSLGFFEYCKNKIGKSTRYLLKDYHNDVIYNKEWQLVVPLDIFNLTLQGGNYIV